MLPMCNSFYNDVSKGNCIELGQMPILSVYSQALSYPLMVTKWMSQSPLQSHSQYPTPNTRIDLCSFFGLVNQLSSSTNTIATLLAPLRLLFSTKNDFIWSADHDEAFTRAKMSLLKLPVLSFFNLNSPTHLSTDARHWIYPSTLNNQTTSRHLHVLDSCKKYKGKWRRPPLRIKRLYRQIICEGAGGTRLENLSYAGIDQLERFV